jgi:hypothetical protein
MRAAELPSSGSLAPLFYAFGLITADQLSASDPSLTVLDTNFLGWLQETVQEAVSTAEQHEMLKNKIRRLRDQMGEKYSLTSILVGENSPHACGLAACACVIVCLFG